MDLPVVPELLILQIVHQHLLLLHVVILLFGQVGELIVIACLHDG